MCSVACSYSLRSGPSPACASGWPPARPGRTTPRPTHPESPRRTVEFEGNIMTVTQSSRERSSTTDIGTSNLVAVEPGAAIREDTPPGSVIQYSDYTLDASSPFAGGVAWIEGEYVPAAEARISIFDAGFPKDELAEITKRCVSMSQLRESFVNLTVTRGYGKRKGEKDLSKLTHQVYIYAIPYLWAFPPAEQ